jgi:hypothetical protein
MKHPAAIAALLLAASAWLAPAHAELWGYVDEKGVGHFAPEQLDERYQLFFRGDGQFDTANGVKPPRPVTVPTSTSSKLLTFFDISPNFRQVKHHLREASREHGVEYELLQALIATESGFDPAAVSPKGAVGLMQIMPATAERYGVRGDLKTPVSRKLTDPRTNVRTGARYLRDLIRMYPGQLELALAAYNAGEGAVQRAGNRIPNYPETRNYVKTVMQLYAMLKPPVLGGKVADGTPPARIRMEIPAQPGRRNMPAVPPAPEPAAPGA